MREGCVQELLFGVSFEVRPLCGSSLRVCGASLILSFFLFRPVDRPLVRRIRAMIATASHTSPRHNRIHCFSLAAAHRVRRAHATQPIVLFFFFFKSCCFHARCTLSQYALYPCAPIISSSPLIVTSVCIFCMHFYTSFGLPLMISASVALLAAYVRASRLHSIIHFLPENTLYL